MRGGIYGGKVNKIWLTIIIESQARQGSEHEPIIIWRMNSNIVIIRNSGSDECVVLADIIYCIAYGFDWPTRILEESVNKVIMVPFKVKVVQINHLSRGLLFARAKGV